MASGPDAGDSGIGEAASGPDGVDEESELGGVATGGGISPFESVVTTGCESGDEVSVRQEVSPFNGGRTGMCCSNPPAGCSGSMILK